MTPDEARALGQRSGQARVQDTHLDAADITDVSSLVVTMREGSMFRVTVNKAGGTTGAQSGGGAGEAPR